jgi:hypothetical protein
LILIQRYKLDLTFITYYTQSRLLMVRIEYSLFCEKMKSKVNWGRKFI